ncbi:hypothetical protein M413DRAFT_351521 [Hebeloma cylindrosporum]|uniref:Uncharacterized protein n=1 Tax=Hebeloma cylindrosporum TaxID=76867 RepID=A0A0C3BV30_HEBCY|nr:hypothetical protein M413DRAFT_351521 [Hebeloma cylindrosporum h7]
MRLLHHFLSPSLNPPSLAMVALNQHTSPRLCSGMNSKEDSSDGLSFLTFTGRTIGFGAANGNDGLADQESPSSNRCCGFTTVGQGRSNSVNQGGRGAIGPSLIGDEGQE